MIVIPAIIIALAGFFIFVPSVSADALVINEFMANPSSGNDWIELYNPTASSIDLTNWILADSTSTMKTLSGTIAAGAFTTFDVSTRLNKTSDSIYLKDPTNTIDSYSYTTEPSTDVSIGRSPDGNSWATLSSSSKGSSNGGASPSPSPSPPASSTSSFTISNTPSSIDSTQTFTTSVNLELSSYPNTKFYLKGAFIKSGSTNYFGFTKVSNSWVKNGNTYSSQYEVSTDSSGKWSGNLEMQPDVMDSGYEGTNDYIFKVARYASNGSGPTWSNEANIKINAKEVEMSEESINLAGLSPPKPSAVLGESKKQENLPEIVYSLEKYKKSSTPSSRKISSPSAKVKVASQKIPLLFYIIGGVLIFAAGAATVYIHEKIRN